MDHRKRPFLALSIWRDIVAEYPKAHLTMLGGGLLLDEARKRAELLPPGTISLPGPTRDVRSHYQQSQILLHTSSREGIPLVLFEAMNYGIPVVTTNSGATAELIKDGQTGILAAINDEAALTAGLRRLIADPRLRGAMGEAARARGAAMFDIEEYLRQILQAYVELGGIELPFIHSQNGQKPTAARGGGYAGAGASPGVP